MAFVELNRLWVKYGDTIAVRSLSFAIPQGSVFGFIGPNGAGKTSTIKVLATLLAPAAGTARINGINVRTNPSGVRRIIGYMPDFFGVYDDLTVAEYLHFFAAAYRMDRRKRRSVVGDVLSLTDLTEKRDTPVDALSRGMKQRLGLARVLLHDPELLLLDEPASGLDPRARIEIRELLKELKNMGKTILVSSHILHELSQICTRIGIIEQGRLVAEGSLDDIYAQLAISRIIHVRIANTSEELLEKICKIDGVVSVEREIDRISVEDLLDRMCGLGARVQMFQPEAMDMETVFMKLTEGKTA
ncbi:MAG: multidrug ABC transporter ATP-binding protein [Planctomycetes bacterium SM23_65]|nr:MAG: multidrug ABC transporter ATP-binding protein [Planctomycetes bacterium SM23_65]